MKTATKRRAGVILVWSLEIALLVTFCLLTLAQLVHQKRGLDNPLSVRLFSAYFAEGVACEPLLIDDFPGICEFGSLVTDVRRLGLEASDIPALQISCTPPSGVNIRTIPTPGRILFNYRYFTGKPGGGFWRRIGSPEEKPFPGYFTE